MAGTAGFELFGPWKDQKFVLEALERAGEKYNLRKVGSMALPHDHARVGLDAVAMPRHLSQRSDEARIANG